MADIDNLFSSHDINNTPDHNSFNLSHRVKFTAKAGELLPIFHKTVMPGDEVSIDVNSFTRTSPTVSNPMTSIREFVDVFFVPYRQLFRNAPQILAFNRENPISANSASSPDRLYDDLFSWDYTEYVHDSNNLDTPSILNRLHQRKNALGFDRAYQSIKLLNYLRYPYISSEMAYPILNGRLGFDSLFVPRQLSIAPLLAYQKIYNDYFRNTQWENSRPNLFNIDYSNGVYTAPDVVSNDSYWDNPTTFDLQYVNYPKDVLFGIMPNTQYGDVATVPIDTNGNPIAGGLTGVRVRNFNSVRVSDQLVTGGVSSNDSNSTAFVNKYFTDDEPERGAYAQFKSGSTSSNANGVGAGTTKFLGVLSKDIAANLNSTFNILDLRQGQFLQRFKEIIGSGRIDYKNLVRRIFGFTVHDAYSDTVSYLGGHASNIDFNEQTNTNITEGNQPVVNANGASSTQSGNIQFTAPDFGILMVVYHVEPVVDYDTNGVHPDILKTSVDDYANPVFDRLGFQELPTAVFYSDFGEEDIDYGKDPKRYLGYTLRYYDYKSHMDCVLGDFKETRSNWIAPINTQFFKDFVNPETGSVEVNPAFFKIDPSVLDPIFYLKADDTVASDQFLCSFNFKIYANRNLNRLGIPNY